MRLGGKIVRTRQTIERRSRLVVFGVVGLLAAIMALLGWVAVRSLNRIDEIYAHQEAAMQIRAITARLERALVDEFTGVAALDSTALSGLRAMATDLSRPGRHLDPQTVSRLARLDEVLRNGRQSTAEGLAVGLSLVRGVAEA
ncbi:MAG: hypothetical protein AMS25_18345, partial [Gemmatimonas sp. SM23_52]